MFSLFVSLSVLVSHVFADGIPGSSWAYPYPYPLHYHTFTSQRQLLSQAYMDIQPNSTSNNQTIMLLHGKNFCGATWVSTIQVLASTGYRVLVPDQIGFCKSSKPHSYQFSLAQLASNTKSLLDALHIPQLTIMGHSMGGMLATRFALSYPNATARLILVDPLGLEDWTAKGVPYTPIDTLYQAELASNYTTLRTYQQATYYAGTWKPAYDIWVHMLASLYNSTEGPDLAWNGAQVTDALLTQPVVYNFKDLKPPTLLVVGDKDNTAIGKQYAAPEVQRGLGNYAALGPVVAGVIPRATYVHFEELGHAPQIQEPEGFHRVVLEWLEKGVRVAGRDVVRRG